MVEFVAKEGREQHLGRRKVEVFRYCRREKLRRTSLNSVEGEGGRQFYSIVFEKTD